MAGSIDLNTNRGVAVILCMSAIVGGGASALQNQVFGPGGEWQKLVTNQAVIQEQIKTFDDSLEKLSGVLENGFQKVAESSKEQNLHLESIQGQLNDYSYEIKALKMRMDALESFRRTLETKEKP